jgi:hypothetical protein
LAVADTATFKTKAMNNHPIFLLFVSSNSIWFFLYALLILVEFIGFRVSKKKIKEQGILMRRILNWQKGFEKWEKQNEIDCAEINKINQSLFDEIDELKNRLDKINL